MELKPANRLSESRCKLARIESFDLPQREAHRLRAMGAFEGQQVEIDHVNSVVMLTVIGTRIAIAKDAADRIFVAEVSETGKPKLGSASDRTNGD